MNSSEQSHGPDYGIHRIEEETGFKPNQLVSHTLTKIRGRAKGYFVENGIKHLVVHVQDMSDVVSDKVGKWEKIEDN